MTKTAAAPNENHHLWNNNGTYWCHFTVHPPDYTKRRVRVSLHTSDLAEARRRRDALLASVPMIVNRIPRGRTRVRPDAQRGAELPRLRPAVAAAAALPGRAAPRGEARNEGRGRPAYRR